MTRGIFRWRSFVAKVVFALGIGVAAVPGNGGAADLTKVRVGTMPYQDYLSIYIAQQKGWFKEEGIDVDIITLDWYDNVNEALAGGSIDIGSSTPDSRLAVYQTYPGAKLAFLGFSFEAFGLIADPKKFKPAEQFLADNNGDKNAAVRDAMAQTKGKKICFPTTGGTTTLVETALSMANLTLKDIQVIDLDADEALQAFYAGQCDVFMAGLPQRQRALKDGYKILVSASSLPPKASELVGWAATNSFAEAHPDAVLAFMRGWYRGMQFIKSNPNEGFDIIVKEVNKLHGKGMTVADLASAWQTIELFPNDACEAQKFFFAPTGDRYWRAAYDAVMESYVRQGKYKEAVAPEKIVSAPQFEDMYVKKYGCL
jgi:NitT/TauT family transport system substrate-binding protein